MTEFDRVDHFVLSAVTSARCFVTRQQVQCSLRDKGRQTLRCLDPGLDPIRSDPGLATAVGRKRQDREL